MNSFGKTAETPQNRSEYSKWHSGARKAVWNILNVIPPSAEAFRIFLTLFRRSQKHLEYSKRYPGRRKPIWNIPNAIPAAGKAFGIF
ncbi:MAG: hypothetical protein GC192_04015 [Bacteroidetes bacterium]|nr:hypothetical protein [Bacteroidota bacterium]